MELKGDGSRMVLGFSLLRNAENSSFYPMILEDETIFPFLQLQ